MRVLLLDGDILLYTSTTQHETEIDWGEDFWTLTCDFKLVKQTLDQTISDLVEKTEAEKVEIALSDRENFRKNINPSYKANRKSSRKPICFVPARDYLIDTHDTYIRKTLEADDVMGVRATRTAYSDAFEYVIVSPDIDLLTIPGYHWDYGKEVIHEVSENEANYNFYTQVLTGDAVDGYPGCPGIGPKKAEKILDSCTSHSDFWTAITNTYESAGLTEDDAILNARMARILRWEDYQDTKVKLWMPYE